MSQVCQANQANVKGQKFSQIVTSADCDKTTVLASCSADGKVLPHLIIYQEMNVQTSWRPNLQRDHPNYPWLYGNKSSTNGSKFSKKKKNLQRQER